MRETKPPVRYPLLIITAVLTGIVISIPWVYFYIQQQQRHTITAEVNGSQIESLQKQYEQQSRLNRELVNNLSDIQEARAYAETQLAETAAQLKLTEEKYSKLEEMDWKSKYEFAMLDNETLVEKIAELEFRHQEEIDNLSARHKHILTTKTFIEEEFIRLEFEHEDLLGKNIFIQNQYDTVTQQLNQETDSLRDILNKKEKQLKKQQQLVKKLQTENAKYKEAEKQITAIDEPNKVKATTTDKQADKLQVKRSYRTARLRSLSAAMLNRKSSDRRDILISVIPNIPNGISGNEFSALVDGMDSPDILTVIQKTQTHFHRPLNSNAFKEIAKDLNKQDAALANNLLVGE